MTFTQIVNEVLSRMNLSTTEATTRVGSAVNRHYKRVTSELGMETTRFVTRNATTTNGVATVTFTSIEKIDRVIDGTDSSAIRLLQEASLHEIRSTQPGTGDPSKWATQNTGPDSVTILMDVLPQTEYTLHADGWTSLADLSGTDEPVIPESYHDILTWFVLSEEYLRKEKDKLALIYETKAKELLGNLRFHLGDSPTRDVRQNDSKAGTATSGGSGGGGNAGTDAYTQSALVTHTADIAFSGADLQIRQSTSDGSDTRRWTLSGGGSRGTDRGAFIDLQGNEHATNPGRIALYPGNVSGGRVEIYRQDGSLSLYVDSDGVVQAFWGQFGFPATQNPSTNVNVLDDYEEGSWSPTITGTGGASGQAYSLQAGRYVKIGKSVFVTGRVTLSTLGTVTTQAAIGNLPFTSENTIGIDGTLHIGFWSAATTSYVYLAANVIANSVIASISGAEAAATGLSAVEQADLSNTSDFVFSGTYIAAA